MKPLFQSFLQGDGTYRRSAGILIHISSLPGAHGIGNIGRASREFIEFLNMAGHSYWQFLPIGPTSSGFYHSPYMGLSAFAGNPLLIDLEDLLDQGFIGPSELSQAPNFSPYFVEFEKVVQFKTVVLKSAFRSFSSDPEGRARLEEYRRVQPWSEDYALFMALRERLGQKGLLRWPKALRNREEGALERMREELREEIGFHIFTQWVFQRQWERLRAHAGEFGVRLIGDIPIYVGLDSADVWSNPRCFELDEDTLRPLWVAGVPPDYFSPKGQLWGNPVYKWRERSRCNQHLYHWWESRLERMASLVDVVRIDHFRGFQAYWRVPYEAKDARSGQWVKGPGMGFFRRLERVLNGIGILAEDLGTITSDVEQLRDRLGFPGMKVLQFAFDSGPENPYLPHNFPSPNCVVYTGTHDNDTCVGWYLDPSVPEGSKAALRRYANSDGNTPHLDFLRLAYSSVAALAVAPMQDVLGFGSDCRMNRPSTVKGNWVWRCAPHYFTPEIAGFLRDLARFYNRSKV